MTRTIPALAARIPPFSFTPALNALVESDELVIEAAVPGVDREDIAVTCTDGMLAIAGIRSGHGGVGATSYSHTARFRTVRSIAQSKFHLRSQGSQRSTWIVVCCEFV